MQLQTSVQTKVAFMPEPESTKPQTGQAPRRTLDAALMVRINAQRDRSALAELAGHYAPRLKGWLTHRGVISETAEDLVQDALIKVWQKSGQFDANKASFSTWVYRITRNCWLDHKRKQDRLLPTTPETMSVLSDAPTHSVDQAFDEIEAANAVTAALADLPDDTRNMLFMSFFEGLSHSQIADRTGLPLGTVKSRIRAPLKRLQSRLEAYRGVYK